MANPSIQAWDKSSGFAVAIEITKDTTAAIERIIKVSSERASLSNSKKLFSCMGGF